MSEVNETPPLGKMEREAPENSVREINDVLNGYFLKNSNLIPKKHNEQNSKRAILVTEYSEVLSFCSFNEKYSQTFSLSSPHHGLDSGF